MSTDGKPEQTVDAIVHGALYDFAGFLTTRETVIPVGSTADAAPMAQLVDEFAKKRGLDCEPLITTWGDFVGTSPCEPAT